MNLGRHLQVGSGVLPLIRKEIGDHGHDVCHAFCHLLDLYPNVAHESLALPSPN